MLVVVAVFLFDCNVQVDALVWKLCAVNDSYGLLISIERPGHEPLNSKKKKKKKQLKPKGPKK
jgi:hypothetical protein